MRRAGYARLAGATFLLYIAASLPAMVLLDRATRGRTWPGPSPPSLGMRPIFGW